MDLSLLTCHHRECFAEVDLRVSRIVAQWHANLAQPLTSFVHIILYELDPASIPVLIGSRSKIRFDFEVCCCLAGCNLSSSSIRSMTYLRARRPQPNLLRSGLVHAAPATVRTLGRAVLAARRPLSLTGSLAQGIFRPVAPPAILASATRLRQHTRDFLSGGLTAK